MELGEDGVHKAAALLATARYELRVRWTYQHEGETSDVLREAAHALAVVHHALGPPAAHADGHLVLRPTLVSKHTFEKKELVAVAHALRVGGAATASADREVVDGIEHVGLALRVSPDKTVDVRRKMQRSVGHVAIVGDM